ncbi:MAG: RNA methyltransferase, partial [Eubacterium sp.]
RKDPSTLEGWSSERVIRCVERQTKILETVDKLLKPGGIMVYSTCTFSPEENEQIIENFLGNNRYEVLPIKLEGLLDHGRPEWTK